MLMYACCSCRILSLEDPGDIALRYWGQTAAWSGSKEYISSLSLLSPSQFPRVRSLGIAVVTAIDTVRKLGEASFILLALVEVPPNPSVHWIQELVTWLWEGFGCPQPLQATTTTTSELKLQLCLRPGVKFAARKQSLTWVRWFVKI